MTRCDPPPRCSLTTPRAPSPCRPPCCTRSAHRTWPSAITPPMSPGSTRGSRSEGDHPVAADNAEIILRTGSEDAVPDLASSPQPTNQGAEKRSKCQEVEGPTAAAAAATATVCATAARYDEADGRAARDLHAPRRALADDAA